MKEIIFLLAFLEVFKIAFQIFKSLDINKEYDIFPIIIKIAFFFFFGNFSVERNPWDRLWDQILKKLSLEKLVFIHTSTTASFYLKLINLTKNHILYTNISYKINVFKQLY